MFQHRSSFAVPFTSFWSEDDGKNPPAPPPKPEKPQFDDAQQQHVNDLLAAERRDTEAKVTQRLKDEADAAKKKADEDRERDEAAKRGEFDKVREELEAKVSSTETERNTLKEQNDAYAEIVTEQVEALKKDLPAELLGEFPTEGSALEQLKWLKDRKQVFEVAKTAAGVAPANVTRLPKTPSSSGTGAKTVEQMSTEMRSRISI